MNDSDWVGLAFALGLVFGVGMATAIRWMNSSPAPKFPPPPSRLPPPMPNVKPAREEQPTLRDVERSLGRIELLMGWLTEEQALEYLERGRLTVNDLRRARNDMLFKKQAATDCTLHFCNCCFLTTGRVG